MFLEVLVKVLIKNFSLISCSFLALSSMALATGLDCTKTVTYPAGSNGKNAVVTETFSVVVDQGQAEIDSRSEANETDQNANPLTQDADRFTLGVIYNNGSYAPLRIVDSRLDVQTQKQPIVSNNGKGSGAQFSRSVTMKSSDGFTISASCAKNDNE